jgi:hypothetical protein
MHRHENLRCGTSHPSVLGAHLDTNATQRAALAAALLMGLGILRDVLELPALSEGPGGALERSVADTLAMVLGQTNPKI